MASNAQIDSLNEDIRRLLHLLSFNDLSLLPPLLSEALSYKPLKKSYYDIINQQISELQNFVLPLRDELKNLSQLLGIDADSDNLTFKLIEAKPDPQSWSTAKSPSNSDHNLTALFDSNTFFLNSNYRTRIRQEIAQYICNIKFYANSGFQLAPLKNIFQDLLSFIQLAIFLHGHHFGVIARPVAATKSKELAALVNTKLPALISKHTEVFGLVFDYTQGSIKEMLENANNYSRAFGTILSRFDSASSK